MRNLPLRITDHRRDLVTMAFAFWLMIGLFVDGWAHNNLTELETFLTPWHGLFYAGFAATAGWIVWNLSTIRASGAPIPRGYGMTAVGLGIFAAGGVGDAMWHTILGIETDIDALFSPTHQVLFAGLALILTTPIRSLSQTEPRPTFGTFLPALAGLALTTALMQFMFMYASGINQGMLAFQWTPGEPDGPIIISMLSMLFTTVVVFGPPLWTTSRWHLPFGSYTVILGTLGVLMQGIEEFSEWHEIAVPLIAGVLIDVAASRLEPGRDRRRLAAFAFVAPVILWSVHTTVFQVVRGIGWPIEVWSGAILWTGLAGWGLSLLLPTPVGVQSPAPVEV